MEIGDIQIIMHQDKGQLNARSHKYREDTIRKTKIRDNEMYEVRSIDHETKRKGKRLPNKVASQGENLSEND